MSVQGEGGRAVIRCLAAVILFVSAASASACSCGKRSFDQQVSDVDKIYFATLVEAKVVPPSEASPWRRVSGKFEIYKVLKGRVSEKTVTLSTGLGGGDCGVPMAVSQKYVIFLEKGLAGISDCDGSTGIYGFQEKEIEEKVAASLRREARRSKEKGGTKGGR